VLDFAATGTIETFVVPQTGSYYIVAYGGQGGDGQTSSSLYSPPGGGGLGGEASGDFSLIQGQTLEIAVGASGAGQGGGGGSFVVWATGTTDAPLIVAGGGPDDGLPGGVTPPGSGDGSTVTGGGAGFYSDGAGVSTESGSDPYVYYSASGGNDYADGLSGGTGFFASFPINVYEGGGIAISVGGYGGFGGGGGAGGGGGYTGGDPGEGGSSFVSGDATNPLIITGVQIGDGEVQITYPACFAEGTRLSTPTGLRNVERLKPGDLILSERRGRSVTVRSVSNRRIDCDHLRDPVRFYPVRLRAGAFGPGLPLHDLFLSGDHAVFAEGVLIPVRILVNNDSVAMQPVARVTYWHVEVDEHDILLAEGLPVESYLETDGHAAFIDAHTPTLAPDFATRVWEAQGCAPLRVTGPEVDAVRARLASQRSAREKPEAASQVGRGQSRCT